jgi:hypothetical protein
LSRKARPAKGSSSGPGPRHFFLAGWVNDRRDPDLANEIAGDARAAENEPPRESWTRPAPAGYVTTENKKVNWTPFVNEALKVILQLAT